MARRLIVDDLISDVRSQLDEVNKETIEDEADILPALNRAQDYAADILSRQYESPLLKTTLVTMVSGQSDYPIPEDAFEQRLEKIEVKIQDYFSEVRRISYRDSTWHEAPFQAAIPSRYSIIGNQFRLYPRPNGAHQVRLWYLKDPDVLVKQQGRITIINETSNYIVVDSIGPDLTPEMDELNSYVNIVDGQSGDVKATMQIQSINGNKVTFKTIPTRTSVLNRDISDSLLDKSIEQDDLICVSSGNCVPYMKKPVSNFLVEYAVAELVRKLGGDAGLELGVLKKFEEQVEKTWVGREQELRVKRRSRNWDRPYRRYFIGNS